MKTCDVCCLVLLIISGILWGLIGLFNYNVLDEWMGPSWLARLVGFIFGVAAILSFITLRIRRRKGA
ncbi:MAG TPA: DUF378 domain-containing protein [Chlamydiales bacterium]|nr:DUF378 domain-containing protein [Chlamydiales bacterium]